MGQFDLIYTSLPPSQLLTSSTLLFPKSFELFITMVAYNAVVGAHQDVVNTILPEAYTAVYGTGLLTQDIDINQAGFSKVHFDVTKAPTVNFTVSPPAFQGDKEY